VDGKEHYFQNVMFVPEIKVNLFSFRSVAEKGFKIIAGDKWSFKKNGTLVVKGHRKNNMYILDINVIHNQEFNFVAGSQKEDSLQAWHEWDIKVRFMEKNS